MAATPLAWDPPSPRTAELIRRGAQFLLDNREQVFAEVDAAVLADAEHPVAADPLLSEAVRRANHTNLVNWAEHNVRDPGAPVPPNVGPEALAVARDLVRRGLDDTALQGYRVGQNVAWERWMALAFELTSDAEELRELLAVTARSIFSFVDGMLERIAAAIEREREELKRGTHAQRLEVVSLLLEAAPIARDRAAARLGYALDRPHTAAIVWSEAVDADPGPLDEAVEALGRAAGGRPLTVLPGATSRWVWVSGSGGPDRAALEAALEALPGVRVALGPTAPGVAGFRRSHLDALATHRLMHRAPAAPRLASYDEVQVVALATQDEERADAFVARTLGELAAAPRELQQTARVYLREGSSATRAARVLFTHRNTVLARLARVEQLLPAPLEGRGLQVGLALEILRWRAAG